MNQEEALQTMRRQLIMYTNKIHADSRRDDKDEAYHENMEAIRNTTTFVETAKLYFNVFSENEGFVIHGFVAGLAALIDDYDDPFVSDGNFAETERWLKGL